MASRIFNTGLLLAALSFACSFTAYAQGIPSSVGGLELSASADNPVPGQMVTITAASYGTDITGATISWTVNGKAVQSGVGDTTYALAAPALGKNVTVNVSLTTPGGSHLTNSMAIGSGSVDMVIESDGYVPPLFPGKAAPAYQNSVKVVAVPHMAGGNGKEYDPATLLYQWKRDGVVDQDQSGYGKQSAIFPGDIVPRPYSVSVTVSSLDDSAQAAGTTLVSPQAPSMTFYVDDPLYGPLYNLAVDQTVYIGAQQETSVIAVPYGFDKPAASLGDLTLDWQINGVEHPELGSSDSVVLRAPDGTSGTSQVELQIRNSQDVLQGADGAFTVDFSPGAPASSSPAATF